MTLLNWLFDAVEAVGGEAFASLWVNLIWLLALLTFGAFHWRSGQLAWELNQFLRNEPKQIIRSLQDLHPLDGIFGRFRILNAPWKLYRQVVANGNWEEGLPSPLPFFSQERLMALAGSRRVAEIIPGTLTALGILGTFIGLSAGLQQLDVAELGTPAGLQRSVAPLLGGMKLAFYTSVVGIATSILWSAADRLFLRHVLRRLNRLHDRLDAIFPPILETELINKLVQAQEQQLADLRSFMTEQLIPQMSDGIRQAMEGSLGPQMERTVAAMEEIGRKVGDRQFEGVQQLVDTFLDRLNSALDNQIEDLTEVLRETVEWQRTVKVELSDLLAAIQQTAEAQRASLTETERVLERVGKMGSDLAQHVERIEAHVRIFDQVIERLGEAHERAQTSLDVAATAESRLTELRDELLQKTGTQIQEMQGLWQQVSGQLQQLASELREASGEVRHRLGEDLNAFVERMHQGLGHTFTDFDGHLSEATARLGAVVAEVHETVEDLPTVLRQMEQEVAASAEQMAQAAAALHSSVQELPAGLGRLEGEVQRVTEQVAALAGQASAQNQQLVLTLQEVQNHFQGLAQGLGAVNHQLAAAGNGSAPSPSDPSSNRATDTAADQGE